MSFHEDVMPVVCVASFGAAIALIFWSMFLLATVLILGPMIYIMLDPKS